MARGTPHAQGTECSSSTDSFHATEFSTKDQRKLFFKLKKTLTKTFGKHMDRNELEMIIKNLDEQSQRHPSIQISKLSIKDVESSLGLSYDKNDTDMSGMKSLELPPHLGT